MAAYRGVEAERIAQTAQDALEFLKDLDLGPEHSKALEEWLRDRPLPQVRSIVSTFARFGMAESFDPLVARGPLAAIRAASSDEQLRDTMKQIQFNFIFKTYEPLLAFFALSDHLQNGDNRALEVYRGLKSWGAFTSNQYAVNPALEQEINGFLQRQYAERWDSTFDENNADDAAAFNAGSRSHFEERMKKATMSGPEGEARAPVNEDALARTEKSLMSGAESVPAVLPLLLPEEVTQLNTDSPDILAYALRGMQNAILIEKHGHLLETDSSPFSRYRVEARSDRAWAALNDGLKDFITPFFDRDEIMVSDLAMENRGGRYVLSFSGTRSVAQAFADAWPDLQVFDSGDRSVRPQASGNSPSGLGPSP